MRARSHSGAFLAAALAAGLASAIPFSSASAEADAPPGVAPPAGPTRVEPTGGATSVAPTGMPPSTDAWHWSGSHRVRALLQPSISPAPLLTLHSWTVRVADADGKPIDGASVTLVGAMPEHTHGLPTVPIVVPLGSGAYRVDGVKFHMPGRWVLLLRVQRGAGDSDTVTLELDVR